MSKVVLAYSGGLDTSVILTWLKEEKGLDVVAYIADVGQNEEVEEAAEKARRTGASAVYVEDLKEEFARDFIFPALQANAVYEGTYLLGTALARPLIAKRHVEIARREGAEYVSHGATGKGNDQCRFEITFQTLEPSLKIIAPWREWDFKGRSDLIAYAREHGIPTPVTAEKPYSMDRNLLHISFEGGILEDPWTQPDEDMFVLSVSPEKAPDRPTYIEIEFERGVPAAVDGKRLSPADLVAELNRLGGENGIGRIDIVENRFTGMKDRGVYETPGGTILHIAHRALESITLDREVMHFKDSLITRYSEGVYNGFWYAPEMELLRKTVAATQESVNGTVRCKLYKGNCMVVGRKSPTSLYSPGIVSFEKAGGYRQSDATGFIRLNALRLRIKAQLEREREDRG
ncbi:MAG TPA: argininosuccinate synthase [bacterium]|nr:argininosuccinate synthase [bacterium]HPQ66621.1 argininosuccinate synthase [bacterium]